jgi:hypothetical protein
MIDLNLNKEVSKKDFLKTLIIALGLLLTGGFTAFGAFYGQRKSNSRPKGGFGSSSYGI